MLKVHKLSVRRHYCHLWPLFWNEPVPRPCNLRPHWCRIHCKELLLCYAQHGNPVHYRASHRFQGVLDYQRGGPDKRCHFVAHHKLCTAQQYRRRGAHYHHRQQPRCPQRCGSTDSILQHRLWRRSATKHRRFERVYCGHSNGHDSSVANWHCQCCDLARVANVRLIALLKRSR